MRKSEQRAHRNFIYLHSRARNFPGRSAYLSTARGRRGDLLDEILISVNTRINHALGIAVSAIIIRG